MDRDEIMQTFRTLAGSQGKYGRLVWNIEHADPDDADCFLTHLENDPNITDWVSLVMAVEEYI